MAISTTRNTITERGMRIAENRIPGLAAKAGHEAYKTTLKVTGAVTVKASNGQLVKRQLDGSVLVIKDLAVGKRVKIGTVLKRVK